MRDASRKLLFYQTYPAAPHAWTLLPLTPELPSKYAKVDDVKIKIWPTNLHDNIIQA